jgi:hypothetical protein
MPYRDREAKRAYQRQWIQERRSEYLEGKNCAFCTATEDLEVHHFDPGAKVSHAVWSWSKVRREAELAKCIVLCRACHIRRHHEKRQTHCKRGHELTRANLYVKPSSGTGECRTCRSLRRVSSGGGRVPERSKGAAC